jgi:hypothetical protein
VTHQESWQSAQDEYRALRATVRERGTARVWVFVAGLLGWAALTTATAALTSPPVATLIPLVALASTFEAVLSLHAGVERIGRYLRAAHHDEWERVAAAFGRPTGAITIDPLFTVSFLVATVVNLEPLMATRPTIEEFAFVGGAHVLFALRIILARVAAARQRAVDAERFDQIVAQKPASTRAQ